MNDALVLINSAFEVVAGLSIALFVFAWLTLFPSLGLAWVAGWL